MGIWSEMPEAFPVGIFPRSDRLVKTWKAYERGEVEEEELNRVYIEHLHQVYREMVDAGVSYTHDPQSNWHDIFRPFTKMPGVEAGPVTRWYENNTFYRMPIIKEPRFSPDVMDGYLGRQVERFDLISLPGPYTMARLSKLEATADEVSSLIYKAVNYVLGKGYRMVFLHEPEAVYRELDTRLLEKVYRPFKDMEVVIHTYFGDASKACRALESLGIGYTVDLMETPLEALGGCGSRILGAVDGANTLLEDPGELVSRLRQAVGEDFTVINNVDLDFLPYSYAVEKLRILGRIRGVG